MRQLLVLLLATALAAPDGLARSRADAAACAEVKQEIREIESKMRSGYTRAQGEKYEARLRTLKAKRRKLCR